MKFFFSFLLILPLIAQGQSPFQYPNTEDFHYFTSKEIDSLELYSIYELNKSKYTGGMGENVDLMEYHFSPAEGYYSANWFPIYDSTNLEPVLDSIFFDYGEDDYLNGSEWVFENGTLSAAGGHGYGTMTMNYYEYLDSILFIERHTKRAPYMECGYVTYNNYGLPHQMIGWKLIDLNEENIQNEELESIDTNFNYLTFFEDENLDTLTYVYDENFKITQMIESSTGEDHFNLFEPLEPQNYYAFSQCYWETEPLENKIKELTGYFPSTVAFEISPFHIHVFKLDQTSGKYHFWNSMELY